MIKFFRNIRRRLLRENRFTRYLIYALGEIILVVIGILIALQINNWNEDRKNQQKLNAYKKALTSELLNEKKQIEEFLIELNQETKVFKSYEQRIASTQQPFEEVYQIARYEYSPMAPTLINFNNNTYSVLLSTGDIDLFEEAFVQDLYRLYRYESHSEISMDQTWENYRDVMSEFTKSYPIDVSFSLMSSGMINDNLWEGIDKKDLANQFNAVTIAKQNYIRVCLLTESFLPKIDSLLIKIKNE